MEKRWLHDVNLAVLNLVFVLNIQLRYKETFERAKGHYHTVKDALDITYHRRVTDDISEVGISNPVGVKLVFDW